MIVTCPACRTRYRVDEEALGGAAGRTVRCAQCGNTWHHRPEPPPATGPEPAFAEPADSGPIPAEPPLAVPPRPTPVHAGPPPRRSRAAMGGVWLVLIVVIAALLAAALIGREQVAARFPQTAPVYAFIGLPVAPAARGLQIRKIQPTRSDGGLVIEGEIANTGTVARAVPRLHVALRDAGDKEVQSKIVAPPQRRLAPGEVEHFKTLFERPNEAATGVVVTFASG